MEGRNCSRPNKTPNIPMFVKLESVFLLMSSLSRIVLMLYDVFLVSYTGLTKYACSIWSSTLSHPLPSALRTDIILTKARPLKASDNGTKLYFQLE
jgi:hypothetical protein